MKWIDRSTIRGRIMVRFTQPMTSSQMARRIDSDADACSEVFSDLRRASLLQCLNEDARRSRAYWLTQRGTAVQRRLWRLNGVKPVRYELPSIDWGVYGWLCYSHRSAVLTAFNGIPLQPSEIKRRARLIDDGLRMSANNVRDVIRLFLAKGLVIPVRVRKRRHLRYVLSESGQKMRELLMNA